MDENVVLASAGKRLQHLAVRSAFLRFNAAQLNDPRVFSVVREAMARTWKHPEEASSQPVSTVHRHRWQYDDAGRCARMPACARKRSPTGPFPAFRAAPNWNLPRFVHQAPNLGRAEPECPGLYGRRASRPRVRRALGGSRPIGEHAEGFMQEQRKRRVVRSPPRRTNGEVHHVDPGDNDFAQRAPRPSTRSPARNESEITAERRSPSRISGAASGSST